MDLPGQALTFVPGTGLPGLRQELSVQAGVLVQGVLETTDEFLPPTVLGLAPMGEDQSSSDRDGLHRHDQQELDDAVRRR